MLYCANFVGPKKLFKFVHLLHVYLWAECFPNNLTTGLIVLVSLIRTVPSKVWLSVKPSGGQEAASLGLVIELQTVTDCQPVAVVALTVEIHTSDSYYSQKLSVQHITVAALTVEILTSDSYYKAADSQKLSVQHISWGLDHGDPYVWQL